MPGDNDPELMLIEDMGKLSKDPYRWVLYSFEWGKRELEGHDGPDEWQTKVLKEIRDGLKTVDEVLNEAVASGHGVGKSALVAWLILWSLSTFEDTRGIVTANTDTQLRTKTWPELTTWYNRCITKHWFTITATSIYSVEPSHEKTWRIDAIPWSENNTEAFAGLHNKGKRLLIIFDEASNIPNKIWEVTEGALTDSDTEIIWCVFGNPTRSSGRFKECFGRFKSIWNTHRVDSRTVKITNKKQIQQWLEVYGEDSDFFKVRVRGEFPNVSDLQFIPTSWVDEARKRVVKVGETDKMPTVIGVDPAWSGSDSTEVYLRQGNYCKHLASYEKMEDDGQLAGYIMKFEDEYRADAVFIDFGYGTGLKSFAKQLGRDWKLVEFGGSSNDEGFANKRGEIWGAMKMWIKEGGALPDDPDMAQQLTTPEHYVRTLKPHAGKIIIESKEDLKKRGEQSPNKADALAITFAFPVMSKSQKRFIQAANTTVKYDPLVGSQEHAVPVYNPLSPLA